MATGRDSAEQHLSLTPDSRPEDPLPPLRCAIPVPFPNKEGGSRVSVHSLPLLLPLHIPPAVTTFSGFSDRTPCHLGARRILEGLC